MGGEQRNALLKQYWGTITPIRIGKYGTRPGLCEGAIILAQRQGGDVTLAIRPGTWIKSGDRLVLIEEVSIGSNVHVQAIELAGEKAMRATILDPRRNHSLPRGDLEA
jgi:hypothetical protein